MNRPQSRIATTMAGSILLAALSVMSLPPPAIARAKPSEPRAPRGGGVVAYSHIGRVVVPEVQQERMRLAQTKRELRSGRRLEQVVNGGWGLEAQQALLSGGEVISRFDAGTMV